MFNQSRKQKDTQFELAPEGALENRVGTYFGRAKLTHEPRSHPDMNPRQISINYTVILKLLFPIIFDKLIILIL